MSTLAIILKKLPFNLFLYWAHSIQLSGFSRQKLEPDFGFFEISLCIPRILDFDTTVYPLTFLMPGTLLLWPFTTLIISPANATWVIYST